MKVKFLKYILAAFLWTVGFSSIAQAQELRSSEIRKDSILIGDQVEWVSRISVPSSMTVELQPLSDLKVQGVEFLKEAVDTVSRKDQQYEICSKVLLTSFDSGAYALPERLVRFYENGFLKDSTRMPSRDLYVNTIPIDTATYQLADIKPQVGYPVTFKEVFPWVLLALVVIAVIWLIIRVVRNLKNNKTAFGKPIVQDPPHITALRALDKIRKEKLWEQEGKQKEFYTEVTDTIRVYIEGRFGIQAVESTSNEIFSVLAKEKLPQREFMELKELFDLADLVKFAKYSASKEEGEGAVPVAVRFVNTTFEQELEEDMKNGK